MSLISIVPRKGSRKFKQSISEEFYRVNENGVKEHTETRNYDSERWDDTREERIPIFDLQKEHFLIIDPRDPMKKKLLTDNCPELNVLVKGCKKRYDQDHPKANQIIEEADIFDRLDPFFTHDECMLVLDSGAGIINDKSPLNKIMLLCVLALDDFAIGGSKHNDHLPSKVRYLVVDTTIDRKIKKKKREYTKEVNKILDSLDYKTALKFALALGITQDIEFKDKDLLDELLYDYGHNSLDKISGTNITHQKNFIDVFNMGNSVLDASYIFTLGTSKGIIKYLNGSYQAFGVILGKDRDSSISFLTIPAQNYLLTRISEGAKQVDNTDSLLHDYSDATIDEDVDDFAENNTSRIDIDDEDIEE